MEVKKHKLLLMLHEPGSMGLTPGLSTDSVEVTESNARPKMLACGSEHSPVQAEGGPQMSPPGEADELVGKKCRAPLEEVRVLPLSTMWVRAVLAVLGRREPPQCYYTLSGT